MRIPETKIIPSGLYLDFISKQHIYPGDKTLSIIIDREILRENNYYPVLKSMVLKTIYKEDGIFELNKEYYEKNDFLQENTFIVSNDNKLIGYSEIDNYLKNIYEDDTVTLLSFTVESYENIMNDKYGKSRIKSDTINLIEKNYQYFDMKKLINKIELGQELSKEEEFFKGKQDYLHEMLEDCKKSFDLNHLKVHETIIQECYFNDDKPVIAEALSQNLVELSFLSFLNYLHIPIKEHNNYILQFEEPSPLLHSKIMLNNIYKQYLGFYENDYSDNVDYRNELKDYIDDMKNEILVFEKDYQDNLKSNNE